ncbi:MAG TPA: hypothetical protein VF665_13710 [Longimicrobium sp.]|jgi:hypothetical protein|uniref:hypothetical protein n=1 Tax=Longimicrobium sp. TaxID=2029185 RepID=UPI002EDAC389
MQHTEDSAPASKRPVLAGVAVREEDLEPTRGLEFATTVIRVAAAVVLLLALVQFGVWWLDRPPGGVGLGLLVGDTIRLIVFAALLWAGSDLTSVLIKTHYDIRATRILMARQTYMMKQMGIHSGALPEVDDVGNRRVEDAA